MSQRTNDQIILEQIIKDQCEESEGEFSFPEYFEIYTASQILKNYDLSYDDILSGIVGKGGDGGIDSMFTFVNGELLKEDREVNTAIRKNHIETFIIQSKISASFKEDTLMKFRESAQDLFNLDSPLDRHRARYNSELIDQVSIFREAYSKLARTFPKIDISYSYVTQGITEDESLHPNVKGKVEKLRDDVLQLFRGAGFSFDFIGSSELLEMTRNVSSSSRNLEIAESPIGTTAGSYLCLVSLSRYYEFVSDNGTLARSIFESNVRDYQGNVTVNTGIRKTLENKDSDNFWYLNNGVTIITPKAVLAGKQLVIEDPQIVNGLQTSYEVFKHFSQLENPHADNREVLVRVICEENEKARDRIIRATNSQTSIPPASLRSADEIHRNIEDFLKSNDYYYDRRKNYYKNQGKPASKVISIPYMAQAMMAVVLLRPDSARARPSTLINSENEYKNIFSLDRPIDVYLKVIQLMKTIEHFLRPDVCNRALERKTITNIKYYLAMVVGARIVEAEEDISNKLANVNSINPSKQLLEEALDQVLESYTRLGASDTIAKGPKLKECLLSR